MRRNIRLEEISDGRLYTASDMVKTDCRDCEGCSACCQNMEAVVLDPLDIANLCQGLGKTFEELMGSAIELKLVDGVILPHLKMTGKEATCSFLDQNGRCSVHSFRPGICRLFPLGRYYDEEGLRYFLQVHECRKEDRSKIKVKKWLGIPDLASYEKYILQWHAFLQTCEEAMATLDDENQRIFQLYILRTFYQTPYGQEFYQEFYQRMCELKARLGLE